MFEIVWTLSVAQAVAPGFKVRRPAWRIVVLGVSSRGSTLLLRYSHETVIMKPTLSHPVHDRFTQRPSPTYPIPPPFPPIQHNDLHAANVLVTLDKAACASKPSLSTPTAPAAASAAPPSPPAAVTAAAISLATDTMEECDISSGSKAPGLPQHSMYYQYTLAVPASLQQSLQSAATTARPQSSGSSTTTKQAPIITESPLAAASAGRAIDFSSSPGSVTFTVPAYPCKAMLADFDFAWLPGHPNQKVRVEVAELSLFREVVGQCWYGRVSGQRMMASEQPAAAFHVFTCTRSPPSPSVQHNQVLEFQSDDPVWGVTSTPDDCYDLFM